MKQGWEIKKIKDICDKASSNIAQNKITELDGDYPVYGASGFVQNVDFYHRDTEYIGIVKDGSGVGRVNTYPAYSSLLGTLQYIIPKEGYALNYVAYALKSLNLAEYASGAAIPHIYFKDYGEETISVPPREEQERIVAELDCLSGVIERKREQLQQLDALAQSIFYQMFGDPITNEKGWDVKKWGDLFDTILGKMLDKKKQVETDVVLPYIANTNVQWGYFILDDLKTMTFSNKERIKLKLELGDILICEGGESGRCAVWNGANEEILFQKAIHRARVKNGSTIMPMFVSILLKEIKLNGGLKDYISKSTIEHLTGEKLNLVPIICPPLILQQEFANKIEAIEKQKELIKQSITQTEELFNSRMDYYFN